MPGKGSFLFGLALLILGVAPLALTILFGPADANPIGFGLLAMVSVPVGAACCGLGLVRMLIEMIVRRSV